MSFLKSILCNSESKNDVLHFTKDSKIKSKGKLISSAREYTKSHCDAYMVSLTKNYKVQSKDLNISMIDQPNKLILSNLKHCPGCVFLEDNIYKYMFAYKSKLFVFDPSKLSFRFIIDYPCRSYYTRDDCIVYSMNKFEIYTGAFKIYLEDDKFIFNSVKTRGILSEVTPSPVQNYYYYKQIEPKGSKIMLISPSKVSYILELGPINFIYTNSDSGFTLWEKYLYLFGVSKESNELEVYRAEALDKEYYEIENEEYITQNSNHNTEYGITDLKLKLEWKKVHINSIFKPRRLFRMHSQRIGNKMFFVGGKFINSTTITTKRNIYMFDLDRHEWQIIETNEEELKERCYFFVWQELNGKVLPQDNFYEFATIKMILFQPDSNSIKPSYITIDSSIIVKPIDAYSDLEIICQE